VTVDGTVNGDLIAMGQTVIVTGNVISAGASVAVNGEVGHDVMAAAAAVTLGPNAQIGHSAYTAGGSVASRAGSLIGGSLLIGAGQGLVSGQTTNDLLASASRLRLEGLVGKNAKLSVGNSKSSFVPTSIWRWAPTTARSPANSSWQKAQSRTMSQPSSINWACKTAPRPPCAPASWGC
jgi:hypothetical protein